MLHIIHMLERRFPGNAKAILLGSVLAFAGLLAIGILLIAR